MKKNQNAIVKDTVKYQNSIIPVTVVTTMAKLFVYSKDILIGYAGVQQDKDFDYNTLLNIAMKKDNIEVA